MRYSMIIVDDEFYSRNGITKLIDWTKFDIDIIGMAENGREGIEMINRLRPDIVLSDIRMNGMNGLEMIDRLRKSGCKSRFILISGYREFEYAQKAIEQGVVSYLLKPVDREELIGAVDKVIADIKSCQETGLFSSMENDEKEMQRLLNSNDIQEWKTVCAVCDNSYFSFVSKLKLFKAVKIQLPECIAVFRDDEYFVVVSKSGYGFTAGQINGCFDNTPMLGAAAITGSVKESLNNAITALRYGIYSDEHKMNFYDDIKDNLSSNNCRAMLEDITAEVVRGMELANMKQCMAALDEAFKKIKEKKPAPEDVAAWIKHLLTAFVRISDKMKIPMREYIRTDSEKLFAEKVFTVDNIDRMHDTLNGIIRNLDNCMNEKIQMNGSRGIKLIKMYIDEHYMEDISLKDLEQLFYTELSYLSKLFKKETGMNYLKYITEKRINKAKELLKNTDFTVAQIAAMVSYTDARYFGQLFKKSVGMTVSEYRSKINREGETRKQT